MNKFIFLILLLVSCKEEKERPKVIYTDTQKKENKIDSTEIQVSDLPISMEGTDYLLHPVGKVRVYNGGFKSNSDQDNKNYVSYTVSNYSMNEITGELQNILFQHKDRDSLKPLTNEKIRIQTVTYLDKLNITKKILVYTIYDKDTNKDGSIDEDDVKSLYLSTTDGENFKKISNDFQELIDWELVENKNRLYYRTIEDINKNGKFDKNDKLHYFYVNLNNLEFKISEYFPVSKK